ncbi:conserved domain protein, putative [Staphylococcus aureus]|nr:conserved domain protein, putative [Staphylococcus aureus]
MVFYILFIKPIFEIVFSSNYVKEEFNTKIESSEYRESLDSFNEILMKYLENEINFKEVWKNILMNYLKN